MMVILTILVSSVKNMPKKTKESNIFIRKNEGISSARNTGLLAASVDYILMVDGDDALHPQIFEESIRLKKNIIL